MARFHYVYKHAMTVSSYAQRQEPGADSPDWNTNVCLDKEFTVNDEGRASVMLLGQSFYSVSDKAQCLYLSEKIDKRTNTHFSRLSCDV